MYSHLKPFTRSQVVCREADQADCMFIIRSGEFKASYKARYEQREVELLSSEHGIIDKFMKKKLATRDVEVKIYRGLGFRFGI